MIDSKKVLRYEYKMQTDASNLSNILLLIKQHSAMFYRQFPNRIVNNIYFDTPGYGAYIDHAAGGADREKLRLRWYGIPVNEIEKPVLERKKKYGLVGEKKFDKLGPLQLDNNSPWPIPAKAISDGNDLMGIAHWRLRSVQPVLALRYVRQYFVSADHHFRITVDSDLEYFGLSAKGTPQQRSLSKAPIVIELKYDLEHAEDAHLITDELPFRLSRFSKYIYAVEGLRVSV